MRRGAGTLITIRHVTLTLALTVWAALAGLNAGCASGVRWRYDFATAYEQSKSNQRLTLVYFRQWFLPLCGKMEEAVFSAPELREATRDLTCVRYELYSGDPLSAAWDVDAAPAFVIVDTNGTILARREGEFTVADVTQAISDAQSLRFTERPRAVGSP